MTRVLIVSSEAVGEQMAGPAIRAYELARALAATCEVTLAAPGAEPVPDGRLARLDAGFEDYDALLAAAAEHDVLIAQRLPPRLLLKLEALPCRLVADLYNPTVMEVLEAVSARAERAARRQQSVVALQAVAMCAAADLVICASERQRDLWLGLMAAHGLLDLAAYRRDPSYRSWVDVVPFGLSASAPEPGSAPVLRGTWPGIGASDRIMIWGGGIWNWLDAITVIDAVGLIAEADTPEPVHLFFLGVGRPALHPSDADVMNASGEAIAHAQARGLLGERVHVNRDWVPYAERGRWLLESDLGVSAHRDHLETRFSFRTRVLDYVWAGLPIVSTEGDALGDLVAGAGCGRTVPAGDPAAFAAAARALLEDDGAYAAAGAALAGLRGEMTWETAAAPLVRFCAELADRPPLASRRDVLRRVTAAQYPHLLASERASDGTGAMTRKLARNLGRAVRRR
jgi:glycosyltransferase involved in cell wall biosynthesis